MKPKPMPSSEWRAKLHDPLAISRRAAAAARKLGLRRRLLVKTAEGPVEAFETPRGRGNAKPRVYVSAGLHGDEPGGVEAVLRWLEGGKKGAFAQFDLTVVPCLNPGGIRGNTRLGPDGLDWNRCFARTEPHAVIDPLKRAVRARGPFDMALLLHEDYDGCGLYVYELEGMTKEEIAWGADLVAAARPFLPTDCRKNIDGFRAYCGVITRSLSSPSLRERLKRHGVPEAAWLAAARLAPRVFTAEAPSEFDVAQRADGLRAFIEAALKRLLKDY